MYTQLQMKNLTKEMVVKIFTTLIPHFHCQSQLQSDRNTFYRILHQLFLNRLDGNNKCYIINNITKSYLLF